MQDAWGIGVLSQSLARVSNTRSFFPDPPREQKLTTACNRASRLPPGLLAPGPPPSLARGHSPFVGRASRPSLLGHEHMWTDSGTCMYPAVTSWLESRVVTSPPSACCGQLPPALVTACVVFQLTHCRAPASLQPRLILPHFLFPCGLPWHMLKHTRAAQHLRPQHKHTLRQTNLSARALLSSRVACTLSHYPMAAPAVLQPHPALTPTLPF
jgi:hypothetical protein